MTDFLGLGLGELLWDILPEGRKLGGAPANFAFNIQALGGNSLIASRVGNDDLGREALRLLKTYGLAVSAVTIDSEHSTGWVDVSVHANGAASYHFPDNVAWDFLELSPILWEALPRINAVCFGSLAQRTPISRRAIQDFLGSLPDETLKLFDINLRLSYYTREVIDLSLEIADVLKINDEELNVLRSMFSLPETDTGALRKLCEQYDLTCAACTRGNNGSLVVSPTEMHDHSGETQVAVVDTIGAGDSFSAVLTIGLYLGWDIERINVHANKVAAYVCTRRGAMNPLPATLRML